MTFVDLIVLACSLADPTACREHHLLLQTEGSLNACMMQAPPYLAKWADEHPKLTVVRWRCAWPGLEDRDA